MKLDNSIDIHGTLMFGMLNGPNVLCSFHPPDKLSWNISLTTVFRINGSLIPFYLERNILSIHITVQLKGNKDDLGNFETRKILDTRELKSRTVESVIEMFDIATISQFSSFYIAWKLHVVNCLQKQILLTRRKESSS